MKRYRISAIRNLSPTVRAFTFDPVDERIGFKAGQFVFIHLLDKNGKSILKRPYSIASPPESRKLEFCIKLIGGEMTKRLEKMDVGEVLGISDGGGHFAYQGERKAAFIAGGTGVAPMISILRHIKESKAEGDFILFYSARTEDDILFREELDELGREPNIKVVITLTRQEWKGETGRLCHDMLKRYIPELKAYVWRICGPLALAKSMKECLLGAGTAPKDIRIEGWG